jgi:hypothetical protein
MFALRTITRNEPMTETHTFVSKHRFDSGYCLESEHTFRPDEHIFSNGELNFQRIPKECSENKFPI